jgi:hypothetical protein
VVGLAGRVAPQVEAEQVGRAQWPASVQKLVVTVPPRAEQVELPRVPERKVGVIEFIRVTKAVAERSEVAWERAQKPAEPLSEAQSEPELMPVTEEV